MAINNIILQGRMVSDPEIKKTTNGISVLSFGIAVDKDIKSGDERKADFIDCVAWRSTAEFISKYFVKGKPILIQGRLQTRTYEDRNGNKRKAVEVLVNQVEFCGGEKVTPQAAPVDAPVQGVAPTVEEVLGDDVDLPWEDHDL